MRVVDGSLRLRSSARGAARYLRRAPARCVDAEGFVDTGDMVELRGDRYHFVGRRGGIINVGGLKVHPEEIEAVINRHPAVRDVAGHGPAQPDHRGDRRRRGGAAPTAATDEAALKARRSSPPAAHAGAAQGAGHDPLRPGAGDDRRRQAGARRCVTCWSPAAAAASASRSRDGWPATGYNVIAVARAESDALRAAIARGGRRGPSAFRAVRPRRHRRHPDLRRAS